MSKVAFRVTLEPKQDNDQPVLKGVLSGLLRIANSVDVITYMSGADAVTDGAFLGRHKFRDLKKVANYLGGKVVDGAIQFWRMNGITHTFEWHEAKCRITADFSGTVPLSSIEAIGNWQLPPIKSQRDILCVVLAGIVTQLGDPHLPIELLYEDGSWKETTIAAALSFLFSQP